MTTDELQERITRLKARQTTKGLRHATPENDSTTTKRKPGRPRKSASAVSAATDSQNNARRRSGDAERVDAGRDTVSRNQPEPIGALESDRRQFERDAESGRSESADHGGTAESLYDGHGVVTNGARQIGDRDGRPDTRHDSASSNPGRFTETLKTTAQKQVRRGLELVANLGADEDEDEEEPDEPEERVYSRERAPRPGLRRGASKPKRRKKPSGLAALNPFAQAQETLGRVTSRITEEHRRLFDDEEAAERKQDIADMLQGWGDELDKFLTLSAATVDSDGPCDIWDLSDREALALAGSWLKRAKRNESAAALLRLALEGDDDLQSLIVLGPRLWKTSGWYPEHGGFKLVQWQRK